MTNLDDLKRERDRLLAQEQLERDIEANQRKKNKIKSQIWALKHKKTVKVINVAKRSTVGVGMIFGKVGKAVIPAVKQGARNFTSNVVAEEDRPRLTRRRVVRKKSPKKRVVKKVVRRNYNSMFEDNPFFN